MAQEATRTIAIRVNDVEPGKSIKQIRDRIKELKKAIEGDRHTEKGREGQNSFVMQIMYQDVPVAKFPN